MHDPHAALGIPRGSELGPDQTFAGIQVGSVHAGGALPSHLRSIRQELAAQGRQSPFDQTGRGLFGFVQTLGNLGQAAFFQ